ncbi:hypothetical protein D4R86_04575 [bacterium]|nr:MAG: hypothetical protein D4R86_04575 [bacterium]
MNSILSFLIASLIGTAVIVNGVTLNTQDIIDETKSVVNSANLHQITTALEVYYINKGHYPTENNSAMMLTTLKLLRYLITLPENAESFYYESLNSGQDYILEFNSEMP